MATKLSRVKIPFNPLTGEHYEHYIGRNGSVTERWADLIKGEYIYCPPDPKVNPPSNPVWCSTQRRWVRDPAVLAKKVAEAQKKFDEFMSRVHAGEVKFINDVEWKDDHVFFLKLTWAGCYTGQKTRFRFKDKYGRSYEMGEDGFRDLMETRLIDSGKTEGEFHYVKKGAYVTIAPYNR